MFTYLYVVFIFYYLRVPCLGYYLYYMKYFEHII